jgi:hypothetical protein
MRERPYKIAGHPYSTLLFILFSISYLVATVYKDVSLFLQHKQPVVNSGLALLITLAGIPLYYFSVRRRRLPAKID